MTSDRKESLCADFSNATARASAPRLRIVCPIASARNQRRAREGGNMKSQGKISRRRLLALLGTTGGAVTVGAADPGRSAARQRVEGAADATESDSLQDGFVRAPSLDTRLTRDYGVQYLFVSAGMGFVAYPPLVTAVSNAGGIGILGNAIEPPPSTQQLIRMIAEGTTGLFGVDLLHDTTAFGPATTDAHIDVCIAEGVKLVVFHF